MKSDGEFLITNCESTRTTTNPAPSLFAIHYSLFIIICFADSQVSAVPGMHRRGSKGATPRLFVARTAGWAASFMTPGSGYCQGQSN